MPDPIRASSPIGPFWTPLPARRTVFIFLLLLAAFYYGLMIYNASFMVEGRRYSCLIDDAMISMRYARNLAAGDGLVWNPGEAPVEGFTNPLWVFLMALFHLIPIPPNAMSLCIQICSALCLLLNLYVVRCLARRLMNGSDLPEIMSVVLTLVYLPLTLTVPFGLEVSLCVLLIDWAVVEALKGLAEGRVNPRVYLILGAGLWVRMDVFVAFLALWAVLMYGDTRFRVRHLMIGGAAALLSLGLQTAARLAYFGQWLPNTYYTKLTGYPLLLRFSRGFLDLLGFLWNLNPLLVLLPLVVLKPWRSVRLLLVGSVMVGQAAYDVYVGGDIIRSRFLVTAMPLFFVLLSLSLERLRAACQQSRILLLRIGFWALLPATVLVYSGAHDLESARLWLGDPAAFRDSGVVHDNVLNVRRSLQVERIITPDARVAVTWAGVQGYFIHAHIIDLLGINDPVVARLPGHVPEGPGRWRAFYPGHMKWDYAYSIRKLRPDLVMDFWGEFAGVWPFLETDYRASTAWERPLWFRKDSPRIRWERFRP